MMIEGGEMNFNINDFIKFFGSVYKVALILFLVGMFLIFSSDEIRKTMLLQNFINTYGDFIGLITIISGIILIEFIVEESIKYIKSKYILFKQNREAIEILKNLSIEEKQVLVYFLQNQTSNLGINYSFQEDEAIRNLLANGYIIKLSNGKFPYYWTSNNVQNILRNNWQEIFYEEIFQPSQ